MNEPGVELALCASGGDFDCALRRADGKLLRAAAKALPGTRPELATTVRDLFRAAGAPPEHLQAVHLDVGPGSYTGLRVAATFVRTLAAWQPLRLAVATSFELHALAALLQEPQLAGEEACVLLAGRQEQALLATVRLGAGIELVGAASALASADLARQLPAGRTVIVAPEFAPKVAAQLTGQRVIVAGSAGAPGLFAPQLRARPVAAALLEPLYLSGSYVDS